MEWANNLNSFFQAPSARGWPTVLDANVDLTDPSWAGPGGCNDMDIMSAGCSNAEAARGRTHTDCNNGNQALTEQVAQFALWCTKSAPIILGGDLRRLAPDVRKIITKREMIALDQDPLGSPPGQSFKAMFSSREVLARRRCRESCSRSGLATRATRTSTGRPRLLSGTDLRPSAMQGRQPAWAPSGRIP